MKKSKGETKEHRTMRLPRSTIEKIERMAKQQKRSFNNMLEVIIDSALKSE